MSSWTYVKGQVVVTPQGRGQAAMRFVLEEVLSHQPKVWGSEGPMSWDILQRPGTDSSCNHDEFGFRSNLSDHGWWEEQTEYRILLDGSLRDTCFEDTLRAFSKWMDRLSKRVWVNDMLVRVSGWRRDWNWGEKIFSGSGHYGRNCPIFQDVRKSTHDTRYSVNWRYDFDAKVDFWPEKLVNLLPGGYSLAREHDLVHGLCELDEYLEWDNDLDRHVGADPDILALIEKVEKDAHMAKRRVRFLDQCMKFKFTDGKSYEVGDSIRYEDELHECISPSFVLIDDTGSKVNRVKLAATKKRIENFLTGSLLEIEEENFE